MKRLGYRKLQDLKRSVEHSDLQMRPFCEFYQRCMQEYAGPDYGSAGKSDDARRPVNLLKFGTRVLAQAITPVNPRCSITTKYRDRKPAAAKFKQGGNQLFEEIHLGETFENATIAAMFGPTMAKVGLDVAGTAEYGGYTHEVTRPFCDYVSTDDGIYDFAAKRWDHQTLIGNRWTCDYELLMDSGKFKNTKNLRPTTYPRMLVGGNSRAQNLQRTMGAYFESYRKQVDLIDLWLPIENIVITVPDVDGDWDAGPLWEVEWEGVETGPYIPLHLTTLPDNILPTSPADTMIDLHELVNVLYRKLSQQALRQKTQSAYMRGNEEDASQVDEKGDGEWVALLSPEGVKEIRMGGPDQVNLAFFMAAVNLFYEINGGLNSIAGLGPAADTLGQERIVHQAATGQVRELSKREQRFVKRTMQALLAYEYSDPARHRKIALAGGRVEAWWGPADRVHDILSYDMDLEPYSMTDMTPADRLAILERLVERALPMMPLMEQQGISLKVEGLLRKMAEYSGSNDIDDILTFTSPMMQELQPPTAQSAAGRMPAHTTRTYERVSRPGQAQGSGFNQAMIATLAGGQNPLTGILKGQAA